MWNVEYARRLHDVRSAAMAQPFILCERKLELIIHTTPRPFIFHNCMIILLTPSQPSSQLGNQQFSGEVQPTYHLVIVKKTCGKVHPRDSPFARSSVRPTDHSCDYSTVRPTVRTAIRPFVQSCARRSVPSYDRPSARF